MADDDEITEKVSSLTLLPKSSMDLDAVKSKFHLYLASWEDKKAFLTTDFWTKHWDDAGFSAFTCEYKFSHEAKHGYILSSLLSGFCQVCYGDVAPQYLPLQSPP